LNSANASSALAAQVAEAAVNAASAASRTVGRRAERQRLPAGSRPAKMPTRAVQVTPMARVVLLVSE
jgi:hypothetical protein